MKFGANVAVFILFFGVALIEALRANDWLLAALFALLGFVFLFADNRPKK